MESRTIFISETFRGQVIFAPREKKELEVLIQDNVYIDTSQLSQLSW